MAKMSRAQQDAARLTEQQQVALAVVKSHMEEIGLTETVISEWTDFMVYKNNAFRFGKWTANLVIKASGLAAALAVLWSFLPWSHK